MDCASHEVATDGDTQGGQLPCSFDGGAAERTNAGEGNLECSEKQETPLGKPAVSVHRY